jgi:hypothetical protein
VTRRASHSQAAGSSPTWGSWNKSERHLARSVFDRSDITHERDLKNAMGKLAETIPGAEKPSGKVRAFSRRKSGSVRER